MGHGPGQGARFGPGFRAGVGAYAGTGTRRGLYRSRNGVIMGVCKGLANYFAIDVLWVRALAVLLLLSTGIWPFAILYLLAGFLMKPEPAVPFKTDADREFYDSYAASRTMALGRIKRKFENLDRRIRRMEDIVTSRDFDWERRMEKER